MEYLIMAGVFIVVVTWILGFTSPTTYTSENFQYVASLQRKLCISYVIGFGLIAYAALVHFDEQWWAWLIVIVSGALSFGAFLEAMKTLPNAPKDLQKD